MPLMKVRNQANDGWHTVDHLNFEYISLGRTNSITLKQEPNSAMSNNNLNKIYVYSDPYASNPTKEEIMYKSSTEKLINDTISVINGNIPTVLEVSTSMSSGEQLNKAYSTVNNSAPKGSDKNRFLIEHRTLTDKNETFHILQYWNGTAWVSLNNIWG